MTERIGVMADRIRKEQTTQALRNGLRRVVIETAHVAPPVNNLFATNFVTRRRFPTKKYTAWKAAIAPDFADRGHVPGDYAMILTIDPRSVRKGSDLSNRLKAVEDALVAHGIVEDDSHCVHLSALYDLTASKGMRIEVLPAGVQG